MMRDPVGGSRVFMTRRAAYQNVAVWLGRRFQIQIVLGKRAYLYASMDVFGRAYLRS